MYVCIFVCMYVGLFVCVLACMYACLCVAIQWQKSIEMLSSVSYMHSITAQRLVGWLVDLTTIQYCSHSQSRAVKFFIGEKSIKMFVSFDFKIFVGLRHGHTYIHITVYSAYTYQHTAIYYIIYIIFVCIYFLMTASGFKFSFLY